MTNWIETLTGSLEQKKQYREYKARLKALPEPYREAAKAHDRYLLQASGISDGELLVRALEDLVGLWEQAAADGTPVRDIVGDDPVQFADDFAANYTEGSWLRKERARLTEAMARADRGEA